MTLDNQAMQEVIKLISDIRIRIAIERIKLNKVWFDITFDTFNLLWFGDSFNCILEKLDDELRLINSTEGQVTGTIYYDIYYPSELEEIYKFLPIETKVDNLSILPSFRILNKYLPDAFSNYVEHYYDGYYIAPVKEPGPQVSIELKTKIKNLYKTVLLLKIAHIATQTILWRTLGEIYCNYELIVKNLAALATLYSAYGVDDSTEYEKILEIVRSIESEVIEIIDTSEGSIANILDLSLKRQIEKPLPSFIDILKDSIDEVDVMVTAISIISKGHPLGLLFSGIIQVLAYRSDKKREAERQENFTAWKTGYESDIKAFLNNISSILENFEENKYHIEHYFEEFLNEFYDIQESGFYTERVNVFRNGVSDLIGDADLNKWNEFINVYFNQIDWMVDQGMLKTYEEIEDIRSEIIPPNDNDNEEKPKKEESKFDFTKMLSMIAVGGFIAMSGKENKSSLQTMSEIKIKKELHNS